MTNVKVDQLVKFLGAESVQELRVWKAVEHDVYGLVTARRWDDHNGSVDISCRRILQLSLEHGIAPATKLFAVGHGGSLCTAYQINAGMIFVATNAVGDIWTKDGYIMLQSDIKLLRRTYDKQLPIEYATDKGLYVW